MRVVRARVVAARPHARARRAALARGSPHAGERRRRLPVVQPAPRLTAGGRVRARPAAPGRRRRSRGAAPVARAARALRTPRPSRRRPPAASPARRDVSVRRLGSGIVHLGLGNFHRAHQAVYTEDAGGGWGICGVTRREDLIAAMRAQGCAYCVLERGPQADSARLVEVIREVVRAGDEIERIASPGTRVVTLTISEGGYGNDPATRRLAADHPDRRGGSPRTAVGRLAAGLAARRAAGVDVPLAVISCDNLTSNGELLRGVVAELAGEEVAASADFPSTMVDRIVPATTDTDR